MAIHFSFSFENSREKLRAICLCLLAPNVTNWAEKNSFISDFPGKEN